MFNGSLVEDGKRIKCSAYVNTLAERRRCKTVVACLRFEQSEATRELILISIFQAANEAFSLHPSEKAGIISMYKL